MFLSEISHVEQSGLDQLDHIKKDLFIPGLIELKRQSIRVRVGDYIERIALGEDYFVSGIDKERYYQESSLSLSPSMIVLMMKILKANLLDSTDFHPENDLEVLAEFSAFLESITGVDLDLEIVDKRELLDGLNSDNFISKKNIDLIFESFFYEDYINAFITKGGLENKLRLIGESPNDLIVSVINEYSTGKTDAWGLFYPSLNGSYEIYSGKNFHSEINIYRFYLEELVKSVNC